MKVINSTRKLFQKIASFLGHHSRLCFVLSLLLVVILGWLDNITSYEFGFLIFYFVPIIMAAWFSGFYPAIIVALASTAAWFVADYNVYVHSSNFYRYWNLTIRLVTFLLNAFTTYGIRTQMEAYRRVGLEQIKLQKQIEEVNSLLPVCRSCRGIRDDAEYLERVTQYVQAIPEEDPTAGLCLDCAQQRSTDPSGQKISILKEMKDIGKGKRKLFIFVFLFFFISVTTVIPSKVMAVNAAFDVKKMSDMSDFDPNNPVIPTGDTIKIAVVTSFSGPAAMTGQLIYMPALWAAHDINKRGGLMVDGKKKLVQIVKADHMSNPEQTRKICERMVLQEKVHVLMGTNSSGLMKIINEVADKYKVIAMDVAAMTDELYDAPNFSRYSFMTVFSTEQAGRGMAYYFGQIRKKERKFYLLCQDYIFGHALTRAFKDGLKEYYPEARIVGEDYHKLFLTDFAPYLTKIKASGAEVIFTGDWIPDAANLLKQARQMGITLPFAHIFLNEPNLLNEVGVEGTKGLVQISQYGTENPVFKTPEQIKYYKTWNNLWKTKWKAPYNTPMFEHPAGDVGFYTEQTYWLLSVIERAGSTDPEKIIKTWEGDTYRYENGKIMKMRGCDHKVIQDLHIFEYVPPDQQKVAFNIPPYHWSADYSFLGPAYKIQAAKILPWMDPKLNRCKGKNPAD